MLLDVFLICTLLAVVLLLTLVSQADRASGRLPRDFADVLARALYNYGVIISVDDDKDDALVDLTWRCVTCPDAAALEDQLNASENCGWVVEHVIALPDAKGFLLVLSIEEWESDDDEITSVPSPERSDCSWLNTHEDQGDYPAGQTPGGSE